MMDRTLSLTDTNGVSRRTLLKGTAVGLAGLSLSAGGASASSFQSISVDADNIVQGNDLVSLEIEGSDVPTSADSLNVELVDLAGDVLEIDVTVGDVIVIDGNTVVATIEIPIQELLNLDVSEVLFDIEVLSSGGDILASGRDSSRVIELPGGGEDGGAGEDGGDSEEGENGEDGEDGGDGEDGEEEGGDGEEDGGGEEDGSGEEEAPEDGGGEGPPEDTPGEGSPEETPGEGPS